MSNASANETAADHTSPRFNDLVMESLISGDRFFTQPIREHWNTLATDGAVSVLNSGSHIEQQEFSRDHMVKMLGLQREALVKAMEGADSIPAFKAAALTFIDGEVKKLFFVTNDENQAQLARDYFDTFMDGIVARLHKGPQQEKLATLCQDLKDYYGISLDAYHTLSEDMLMYSSRGDTDSPYATKSLVQLALLSKAKTPQQQEAALALLADKEAVLDPEKSKQIDSAARKFFREFMEVRYSANYDRVKDAQPIDAFVMSRIEQVVAQRHRDEMLRLPQTADAVETMQKKLLKDEKRMLGSLTRSIDGLKDPEYIIAMAQKLDAMQARAAKLPVDFPAILPDITQAAAEQAFKVIPSLVRDYAAEVSQRPVPLANRRSVNPMKGEPPLSSLAERSIPSMTFPSKPTKEELGYHTQFVHNNLVNIINTVSDELSQAHSLEEISDTQNGLLKTITNSVYFGPMSPTALLFTKEYFKGIRKQIEGYLEEEGYRDKQSSALKAMAQIEDKCGQLYEGFFVSSDWLMDLTKGAHDRAVLPAYLSDAVSSGKIWQQLSTEEQRDNIRPKAQHVLLEATLSKGVDKGFFNPLMPYVFEKCMEIATQEQAEKTPSEDSRPTTLKTVKGKFTKKLLEQATPVSSDREAPAEMTVKDRAHALFDQAIALAPEKDVLFSPAHCALMQDFLHKQLSKA